MKWTRKSKRYILGKYAVHSIKSANCLSQLDLSAKVVEYLENSLKYLTSYI